MNGSPWIVMSATLLMAGGLSTGGSGAATIGDPQGIRAAIDELSISEQAQYRLGGRQYCFYVDGWRGPGWYWCGYQLRRGLGWGGPVGWNNWRGSARADVIATRAVEIATCRESAEAGSA